jgi:hypothetical protein
MSKRDPRTVPSFFDVVARGKLGRQVQLVTVLGTVVYLTCRVAGPGKITYYGSREKQCSLETWKRWCKGAKIEARGPEPKQKVLPAGICLDRSLEGEFTSLRNKILGKRRPFSNDFGKRGISDRRLVNALIKLSVAVLEHHKPYDMPFKLGDLVRVLQEDGEDEEDEEDEES